MAAFYDPAGRASVGRHPALSDLMCDSLKGQSIALTRRGLCCSVHRRPLPGMEKVHFCSNAYCLGVFVKCRDSPMCEFVSRGARI